MGKALILFRGRNSDLARGGVLALCLLLAGCGGATYESDFCLLASPLRPNGAAWDAADQIFKQQIVTHNETGARICGWKP